MVTRIKAEGDFFAASRDGLTGPTARPTEAKRDVQPFKAGLNVALFLASHFPMPIAPLPAATGDGR